MPPINTGRSNTSAPGRRAGRTPKTKKNVRRQQREVITKAKLVKTTQAAHKREAERKKALAKAAPNRQIGEGARGRGYEPKMQTRSTSIGTGGRYTPSDVESSVLKALEKGRKQVGKGFSKTFENMGAGERGSGGTGLSSPRVAIAGIAPKAPGKLAGRTAKDLYQYPAQTVTSTAAMVDAANQARKGNYGPAKQILKDLDEHDPVWNSALALGNALTGDKKNAAKRLDQANKSIQLHPGLAALEIYGAKGTVGRLVTRGASGTARTAAGVERIAPGRTKAVPRKVKERARKISSTERMPARVPGTNLVQHRRYSRDAFTRLQQRSRDKYKSEQAIRLRREARDAQTAGKHELAQELREKARRADPEIITGRGIRRAVDEHMDVTERVRRHNRATTERDTRKALKGAGKKSGPIVSLLTQRITKADLPSLKAYRDRIEVEGQKLDSSEAAKIEANGILVRELTEAIKNVEKGKVNLDNLKRISDVYAERSQLSQAELVALKIIDPDQAARRAASPSAVAGLGARKEPATLEAAAKATRAEANRRKDKVGSAERALQRLVGGQRSQVANSPQGKAKREASMKPARNDRARQRARGAGPTRGEGVTGYLKRMEDMTDEQLRLEIKKEAARERKLAKAKQKVERRKAKAKTAKRKASKAAKRARENPLVLPGGKPLSTATMLAEMLREHGTDKAAYVSQAPGQTKAAAYYIPADEAPNANTGAYGGGATREGSFDGSTEALVTQEVRTQGVIDAFKAFQRLIGQVSMRDMKGKPVQRDTYKDAAQLARDRSREGQEWVAIRLNPLGAKEGQLNSMIEGTSNAPIAEILQHAAKPGDDSGPWTIVPKDAADQVAKHMDKLNPGNTQRLAQQGTSAFRRTVLATSPTWFAGNIGEGAFRSAVHGVGPRSYLTGRRARKNAKAIDPEQAVLGEARTIGTGEASLTQMRQLQRDLSQYHDGSIKDIVRVAKAVTDARVKGTPISPRLVVDMWNGLTNFTMNLVNKGIENQFQTAMLGKAIRNERSGSNKRQIAHRPKILMTQRARDLSAKAADEVSRGLLKEDTAAALGREVDRMYGNYSKFSPDAKTAILYYTPFAAWMMNALKFIGKMPEHNPSFTLAVSVAERASEEWRKERGLDMQGIFGMPKDGESVPAWLQGSIPDGKGGHYRAPTRYTPFSVGTDLPATIAGQFLPQIASAINALQGQDWKGQPLRDDDGEPIDGPEKFVAAGDAMLRGLIPFYGQAQRSREKGIAKVFGKEALLGYVGPPEGKLGGAATTSDSDEEFDWDEAVEDDEFDWDEAAEEDDFDWE